MTTRTLKLFGKDILDNIYVNGKLYLTRIYLTPWRPRTKSAWWLHIFHSADSEQPMHDHPFWFDTYVLLGGYLEEVAYWECAKVGTTRFLPSSRGWIKSLVRNVKAWDFANKFRPAHFVHKITKLKAPTITLVHRGPYIQDWGFWRSPTSWTHHSELLDTGDKTGNIKP